MSIKSDRILRRALFTLLTTGNKIPRVTNKVSDDVTKRIIIDFYSF